jgi:ABC-type lipoprotein export system ATPase subunit
MPTIDVTVKTKISQSIRAKQISSMFDVPTQTEHQLNWQIKAPFETQKWNIGLIVGASGSGKSTILNHQFGGERQMKWDQPSVIDDFDESNSIENISKACSAVGFNTIPSWLRPYKVLSTGERFRVSLARQVLETPANQPIVVDEFTSVVDRQVAAIGAHAVAKWVRTQDKQFVAASCHYDILEWLQPDWVIDMNTNSFVWRSVQPRPKLNIEIRSVHYSAWQMFAPFHYLTADLNKAARCYVAFINDQPTAFAGLLHRPHAVAKNIVGVSRLVTLPDWQGLGLAFVLADALGAAYKTVDKRLRTYPAHPALIRGFDKSTQWRLDRKPQYSQPVTGRNSTIGKEWRQGTRPCAVFEYAGAPMQDTDTAQQLLNSHKF